MREAVEFRMHGAEGEIVGLGDLLALFISNDWAWSVLEFDGLGEVPDGLSYTDFQEQAFASPLGYVMSWTQLQEFASGVRQCFDLILVAASEMSLLDGVRLADNAFEACPVVLTASDSTWWTVELDTETGISAEMVDVLRRRYGAISI